MKYFKKLKSMKRTTQFGLAASLAYFGLSFGLNSFANDQKFTDVRSITTIEQVDKVYNERLTDAVSDLKLSSEEIIDLESILDKKISILSNKIWNLKCEISDLRKYFLVA